ncbi:MAG: hypothetical protein ACREN7_07405 [Candidatus Dormibacteria bacterium]
MSEPGSNLARVLAVWGEMSQSRSMAPLVGAMTDDVVWQGLLPELTCHGRDEVSSVLSSFGAGQLPRVTRMAAEELGERLVLTVEGPDFGQGPAGSQLEPVGGPRTLVLWFQGGRITRMESFATRDAALAAAP